MSSPKKRGEGTSCHHCKKRIRPNEMLKCTRGEIVPTNSRKRKRPCVKKYCFHCIKTFYSTQYLDDNSSGSFICPACREECRCAACRRRVMKAKLKTDGSALENEADGEANSILESQTPDATNIEEGQVNGLLEILDSRPDVQDIIRRGMAMDFADDNAKILYVGHLIDQALTRPDVLALYYASSHGRANNCRIKTESNGNNNRDSKMSGGGSNNNTNHNNNHKHKHKRKKRNSDRSSKNNNNNGNGVSSRSSSGNQSISPNGSSRRSSVGKKNKNKHKVRNTNTNTNNTNTTNHTNNIVKQEHHPQLIHDHVNHVNHQHLQQIAAIPIPHIPIQPIHTNNNNNNNHHMNNNNNVNAMHPMHSMSNTNNKNHSNVAPIHLIAPQPATISLGSLGSMDFSTFPPPTSTFPHSLINASHNNHNRNNNHHNMIGIPGPPPTLQADDSDTINDTTDNDTSLDQNSTNNMFIDNNINVTPSAGGPPLSAMSL